MSQVPISTDAFTHKVTSPAWKTKPTWYMVATADRSINPDQERMMAKRAKAKTVEVNSSHVAYMSHPKETAKLIEEAAALAYGQSVKRRFACARLNRLASARPAGSMAFAEPDDSAEARRTSIEESTMEDQIVIESRMERSAPISRGRRSCLLPPSSFCRSCSE